MKLNKLPYRGTRDFFPKDKRIQNYIFEKMKEVAESYGYEDYNGPILEEVELYKAKSGEELINDQIYSFTDRGERFVAIRPEMTPTVARMVAQVHREYTKPLRWYSIQNFMRYEKPQKGRLREFWQLNCDIFGASEIDGEVEITMLISRLFNSLGANEKHFEIAVNDRRVVDSILEKIGANKIQSYTLYKIIDRARKISKDTLVKQVDEVGLNLEGQNLFFDYLKLENFEGLFNFLESLDLKDSTHEFFKFITILKKQGQEKYLKFDPTIVRGLDYYTGIVFEVYDKNPANRRALCGGGAYANLLKIFNEEPIAGVGFGLGDVTLTDFLMSNNLLPDLNRPTHDLFMTFQVVEAKLTAFNLAEKLRDQGLKVIQALDVIKMKKVFQNAEKNGSHFVIMIGEDELNTSNIQLKNLATKEQFSLSIDAIDEIVKIIRG